MQKYFIFISFLISLNIHASPWIRKHGNIDLINSVFLHMPPSNYNDYEFTKEIKSLNRKLLNISRNEYFSKEVKKDRKKIVQSKIDRLEKLRSEKFFYDQYSSNSYIEYSYSDDLAVLANIFIHNKHLKSNKYFESVFAKYKLFEKNNYVCSLISGSLYNGDINFALGMSAGYSWSSKDINYFTYFEPLIVFNSSFKEFKIDYTNGMKFKNNWMLISQTIYKRDVYDSKWLEKISIVKTLNMKKYDLSLEVGGLFLGKNSSAIIFGIWVSG